MALVCCRECPPFHSLPETLLLFLLVFLPLFADFLHSSSVSSFHHVIIDNFQPVPNPSMNIFRRFVHLSLPSLPVLAALFIVSQVEVGYLICWANSDSDPSFGHIFGHAKYRGEALIGRFGREQPDDIAWTDKQNEKDTKEEEIHNPSKVDGNEDKKPTKSCSESRPNVTQDVLDDESQEDEPMELDRKKNHGFL